MKQKLKNITALKGGRGVGILRICPLLKQLEPRVG
jgi:hypothetical protein